MTDQQPTTQNPQAPAEPSTASQQQSQPGQPLGGTEPNPAEVGQTQAAQPQPAPQEPQAEVVAQTGEAQSTTQAQVDNAQSQPGSASLRDKVQAQVVSLLTKGLESGKISEERARAIAKIVLERLPEGLTDQELLAVLPKLDDDFKELADIVLPIMIEHEARIRKVVEERVVNLVRARKFAEAIEMARKAIEYSKQFS